MSKIKTIEKITQQQIERKGVQALADRPNEGSGYSGAGLPPQKLKLHFDNLPTLLAMKINELIELLQNENAGAYFRIPLDPHGVSTLQELLASFENGVFASKILQLRANVGATEREPLQNVIHAMAKVLSENGEVLDKIKKEAFVKADYDPATGKIVFSAYDGTQESFDLPLQLLSDEGCAYEEEDGVGYLVVAFSNGQNIHIPTTPIFATVLKELKHVLYDSVTGEEYRFGLENGAMYVEVTEEK